MALEARAFSAPFRRATIRPMPDDQAQRVGPLAARNRHGRPDPGDAHRPPGPAVSELSLQGVRYRYAGAAAWALDGLDLELEAGEVLGVTRRERCRQDHPVPGRGGPRPGRDRRPARGHGPGRRRRSARAPAVPGRRALRNPVPERGHPAVGHGRDGLGGGRLRAAQPGPRCRSDHRAGRLGDGPRRGRATWPSASRIDCRAARPSSSPWPACSPCGRPPDPRRADEPARPGGHAPRRRRAGPARPGDRHGAPDRRAQDRPAGPASPIGSPSWRPAESRFSAARRTRSWRIQRLPSLGVDPPAAVRSGAWPTKPASARPSPGAWPTRAGLADGRVAGAGRA